MQGDAACHPVSVSHFPLQYCQHMLFARVIRRKPVTTSVLCVTFNYASNYTKPFSPPPPPPLGDN